MTSVFSFVGSCAGEASHTKELSDRLVAELSQLAQARGEKVSYECVTADQLRVSFCRSCNSCFSTGTCPLDAADDVGDVLAHHAKTVALANARHQMARPVSFG